MSLRGKGCAAHINQSDIAFPLFGFAACAVFFQHTKQCLLAARHGRVNLMSTTPLVTWLSPSLSLPAEAKG